MDLLKRLRGYPEVLRKFTPAGRACQDCVFVNMDSNHAPMWYTCSLDGERVKRDAYCEAFFDWFEVADRDLPTSAHEKATLLAQKVATYTSLI